MQEDFPTPPLQGNTNRPPPDHMPSVQESVVSLESESDKQDFLDRILDQVSVSEDINIMTRQFVEEQLYIAILSYTQIPFKRSNGRQYPSTDFVESVRSEIEDSIKAWQNPDHLEEGTLGDPEDTDLDEIHSYAREIIAVLENGFEDNVVNLFE